MTTPLRVLVVDDEPLARSGLVRLLQADPEIQVVGESGDGESAVAAIRSLRPNLVLLDIQMAELDGFGVINAVGAAAMPAVIFLTAYDQFAVRAFEVAAVDYVLKPYDDARLHSALARAKAAIRAEPNVGVSVQLAALLRAVQGQSAYLTRIAVRQGGKVTIVAVPDIDWVEAADYCVRLHVRGAVHVIRESLSTLETKLDPARFVRIHRSTIVAVDRIRELQPYFKGEQVALLADGTKLRVGRSRMPDLETVLGLRS